MYFILFVFALQLLWFYDLLCIWSIFVPYWAVLVLTLTTIAHLLHLKSDVFTSCSEADGSLSELRNLFQFFIHLHHLKWWKKFGFGSRKCHGFTLHFFRLRMLFNLRHTRLYKPSHSPVSSNAHVRENTKLQWLGENCLLVHTVRLLFNFTDVLQWHVVSFLFAEAGCSSTPSFHPEMKMGSGLQLVSGPGSVKETLHRQESCIDVQVQMLLLSVCSVSVHVCVRQWMWVLSS